MSNHYGNVMFEEKYEPADSGGFTVREVLAFIHRYYHQPFMPEQMNTLCEQYANYDIC